jgi:hypothetical protein
MRQRTVIAVGVMDVAAVAAALFLGLQSTSSPATHRLTIAGTPPPAQRTPLEEEELRAQEAPRARAAARKAAIKADDRRMRAAARTAAKASRQQKLRERQARQPPSSHGDTAKRHVHGDAAKPDAKPPGGHQHKPAPAPRREAGARTRRDSESTRAQPQAERRQSRRERTASHDRKHAEHESTREARRGARRSTARERQGVS